MLSKKAEMRPELKSLLENPWIAKYCPSSDLLAMSGEAEKAANGLLEKK